MNPDDRMPAGPVTFVHQLNVSAGGTGVTIARHDVQESQAPRRGAPFMAAPLPASFVERSSELDRLYSAVAKRQAIKGVLPVIALHGLGGIGKTVLAQRLANDERIQEQFPDGILWGTIGQRPDTLGQLVSWIHALGDDSYRPSKLEMATAQLRTLLHNRAVLAILDDVWEPQHAVPFVAGGTRCRLVVTTRRSEVVDALNAQMHDVGVLEEEEAIGLLTTRAGLATQTPSRMKEPVWKALVRECGGLPLAVELVGALISRGRDPEEVLSSLKIVLAGVLDDKVTAPISSLQRRLWASVKLSLDYLKAHASEVWQRFAWLGVLKDDANISTELASRLWALPHDEAKAILDLLCDDSLLQRRERGYRIHDVLGAAARRMLEDSSPDGLSTDRVASHRLFLERYRAQVGGPADWLEMPDDGYIVRHLVWHLCEARLWDELHGLLSTSTADGHNAWYRVCFSHSDFIRDVNAAWHAAAVHEPQRWAVHWRYALTNASLDSLRLDMASQLPATLVDTQMWSPARALSVCLRLRVGGAAALLAVVAAARRLGRSDAYSWQSFWEIVIGAARTRVTAGRAAYALVLAAAAPEAGRDEQALYHEALVAGKLAVPRVAARLLGYLPTELTPELLDSLADRVASRRIRYSKSEIEELIGDAPPQYAEQLRKRLQEPFTAKQSNVAWWGRLLSLDGPAKPPEDEDSSEDEAASTEEEELQQELEELERSQLGEIASSVPMPDSTVAARAWASAAPDEVARELRRALDEESAATTADRVRGLLAVAIDRLPDDLAFEALMRVASWSTCCGDMFYFLPRITPRVRRSVAARILGRDPVTALVLEASSLPKSAFDEQLRQRVINAVRVRTPKAAECLLVARLGDRDLIERTVSLSETVDDAEGIALAAFALAPYMRRHFPADMFEGTRVNDGTAERLTSLARIAHRLSRMISSGAVQDFVIAAKRLYSEWWIVEALSLSALRTRSLEVLTALGEGSMYAVNADLRARSIERVSLRMAECGYLAEARNLLNKIDLYFERARATAELVIKLASWRMFEEAARTIEEIDDPGQHSRASAHFAMYLLMNGERERAERVTIREECWRAWLRERADMSGKGGIWNWETPREAPPLSRFGDSVGEDVDDEMEELMAACAVLPEPIRAQAMATVKESKRAELTAMLCRLFGSLGEDGRPGLASVLAGVRQGAMRQIRALAPLVALCGPTSADDILEAIRDVSRWWP